MKNWKKHEIINALKRISQYWSNNEVNRSSRATHNTVGMYINLTNPAHLKGYVLKNQQCYSLKHSQAPDLRRFPGWRWNSNWYFRVFQKLELNSRYKLKTELLPPVNTNVERLGSKTLWVKLHSLSCNCPVIRNFEVVF